MPTVYCEEIGCDFCIAEDKARPYHYQTRWKCTAKVIKLEHGACCGLICTIESTEPGTEGM